LTQTVVIFIVAWWRARL